MMIKAQMESGRWFLSDGVESLEYATKTKKEWADELTRGVPVETQKKVFCYFDEQLSVDWETRVYFTNRAGERCLVMCNTPVYLLNDEGKTIERI